MDYTARYGLEFNPFIKNSKDIYVETPEFKELRFRLDYLLSTRGFGVLSQEGYVLQLMLMADTRVLMPYVPAWQAD